MTESFADAPLRILLVEDDEVDRLAFRRAVEQAGLRGDVYEAPDVTSALDVLARGGLDCAFVDFQLPGADGLQVVAAARRGPNPVPVVVLTGRGDEELVVEVMRAGAFDYISKRQLTPERVARSVRQATRLQRAERARAEAQQALRRRAEQLQGLADAALAVQRAPSTEAMLASVTERARELIGAHRAATRLAALGSGGQSLSAVRLSSTVDADASDVMEAGELERLVCETNRPLRLTEAEVITHPRRGDAGRTPPLRGLLAAPLIARDGRNLGMIRLSDREDGSEFTAEDEAILVQLAQMAAAALETIGLYETAREAATAREEVLAVVSHDLRSPLSVVSTAAATLAIAGLEPAHQAQAIARINRSVQRMADLVRDLLDVARLEAGKVPIDLEPLPLDALLAEVESTFRPEAAERGVAFRVELATGPTVRVLGDRLRLLQVFQNLIDNALRHAAQASGSVVVRAESEPQGVRLSVSDTGPGIPPEQLPRLFDRFWSGDRERRGTGLGLAIARGIVEAHGADIEVQSAPGRGTAFSFTLPSA